MNNTKVYRDITECFRNALTLVNLLAKGKLYLIVHGDRTLW